MMSLAKALAADPRHHQIAVLSGLLAAIALATDFGPTPEKIAVLFVSCLVTQMAFMRFYKVLGMDLRSPLISALGLGFLFHSGELWLYALVAVLSIGSKFLIRVEGKHIFNPTNFGIVLCLLLFPQHVWISPGQWGTEVWLAFLLVSAGLIVVTRARRSDISLFFLGGYYACIMGRALYLGDPMGIPVLHMQSGSLLIFAFHMISDPKTTPDSRKGRLIFALAVAATGFTLAYGFQIREGVFYALAMISALTPLLDRVTPSPQYQWRKA